MKNLLGFTLSAFIFCLLVASCQQPAAVEAPTEIIVAGKIENGADQKLRFYLQDGSKPAEVMLTEDVFRTTLPMDEAGYIRMRVGREFGGLYANPGDSIFVTLDAEAFDSTLAFSGDGEKINNFLAEKTRFKAANRQDNKTLYNQPYEDFKKSLAQRKAHLDEFYTTNAAGLATDFVTLDKKMEALDNIMTQSSYKSYYEYYNQDEEAKVDDDFENILDQVSFADEAIVHSPQFSSVAFAKLSSQEPEIDYYELGATKYQQELFTRSMNIENPVIKEKASFHALKNLISYGGGLDNITTEVDDFKAISNKKGFLKGIDELVEKWAPLKKGNIAPAFVGTHLDDAPFKSEDLKGKNIYVDVWATWCGPCKREIPHLKEVEKEYHDKNIAFLSISIDDNKQLDTWKEFVDDEDLGGIQVHAPDAWQSEVVKQYKIEGIPRFMLIDAEGKIVSANAPRPSDEALKPALDGLLVE